MGWRPGCNAPAGQAFPGTAIPVGAVTVGLGGLYLVWLLARETSRR